jgi:ubiquinone/menaquinone biosynthesis C-methylase UbiE
MHLRQILLIFSVLMIGFCLSLYFQSDESFQTINYEQYKDLHYKESRSHSLEEFNDKISPYQLEEIIGDIYEKNRISGEKTRVMEIGTGNGRVLMTLKKMFPEIEFYGINKEKTHTFYRRESFILTAFKFNIFNKAQIESIELPYIVFEDLDFGNQIPYNQNKFDLIFSQATITKIKYKFELFNEIMRVLKPGGLSLHTDVVGLNIFANGVLLEQKEAMKELRKKGIEIYALEKATSIRFKKPNFNLVFPVTPHQPLPKNHVNLSQEQRRPEMGYNLSY